MASQVMKYSNLVSGDHKVSGDHMVSSVEVASAFSSTHLSMALACNLTTNMLITKKFLVRGEVMLRERSDAKRREDMLRVGRDAKMKEVMLRVGKWC